VEDRHRHAQLPHPPVEGLHVAWLQVLGGVFILDLGQDEVGAAGKARHDLLVPLASVAQVLWRSGVPAGLAAAQNDVVAIEEPGGMAAAVHLSADVGAGPGDDVQPHLLDEVQQVVHVPQAREVVEAGGGGMVAPPEVEVYGVVAGPL